MCVTFVLANAVMKEEYSKCFVCALAVSDWMAVAKKQKKVIIGNKNLYQDYMVVSHVVGYSQEMCCIPM